MNFALQKNSAITVAKELQYGVAPVMNDRGLAIEASGDVDLQTNFDSIERNIVRKSFSTYAPLRGLQTTSGTIPFELHGCGVAINPPETDVLWECAFGYRYAGATTTATEAGTDIKDFETGAAPTTSTILYKFTITCADVTPGTDAFKVGNVIVVYTDGITKTFKGAGYIIDVNTTDNNLTIVSRDNFAAAIANGDKVTEGLFYSLKAKDGTVGDLPSFTCNFYRGNITKESYVGNIVTAMNFEFQTGQIIIPKVQFEGKTVTYTATTFEADVPNGTLVYDSTYTSPIVARSVDMIAYRTGTTDAWYMPVSSLSIALQNEVNKLQAVTEPGIFQVMRTKRNVTGQLETYYLDKEFQDAFLAEATYDVGVIAGDTIGNIFAFRMPKLKISELSLSNDNGLFKYSCSYSAEPINGDDEFWVQVF